MWSVKMYQVFRCLKINRSTWRALRAALILLHRPGSLLSLTDSSRHVLLLVCSHFHVHLPFVHLMYTHPKHLEIFLFWTQTVVLHSILEFCFCWKRDIPWSISLPSLLLTISTTWQLIYCFSVLMKDAVATFV